MWWILPTFSQYWSCCDGCHRVFVRYTAWEQKKGTPPKWDVCLSTWNWRTSHRPVIKRREEFRLGQYCWWGWSMSTAKLFRVNISWKNIITINSTEWKDFRKIFDYQLQVPVHFRISGKQTTLTTTSFRYLSPIKIKIQRQRWYTYNFNIYAVCSVLWWRLVTVGCLCS